MNRTLIRSSFAFLLSLGLSLGTASGQAVPASADSSVAREQDDPVPSDRSDWAGPLLAEVVLRFGPDGNTAAENADVLPEAEGGAAGIELQLASGGPRTMLEFPPDAGMALGPFQYVEFDIFVSAESDARLHIQVDERAGDEKLRGVVVLPPPKRDEWQTLSVNLLRNELSGDARRGSKIMPDGTPLTRLGVRLDARARSKPSVVRLRNLRLYRQDVLAKAPVAAVDPAGQTALHRAAMMGDSARARKLLESGAEVNATNAYLYTPLALAVISHDVDTVRVLIEQGADVNARRRLGFTPLYDAAADGLIEIMTLLMQGGADPVQKTEYGFEPLFTAVHHGHLEASVVLVEDPRVDVNRPIAGFMPLHVAAQGDEVGPHLELYEKLIELGAEVDLCSASGAGDLKRMQAILQKDPDAAKTTTILGGWTPLHDAVRNVRSEAVRLLLASGADPNAVSGEVDFSSTPLHWVATNILLDDPQAKLTTLGLMVAAGAELDALDKYGATPLDRVRQFRDRELTEALLELGALTGKQVKALRAGEAEEESQPEEREGGGD